MSGQLAVVPIFMSAGAAVLPTVLAALASVGAILLDPRKLIRAVRSHPGRSALVLAFLLMGGWAGWWMFGSSGHAARGAMQAERRVDWAKVGQSIVDRQAAGQALTSFDAGITSPATAASQGSHPPGTEIPASHVAPVTSDFARTNADGSAHPQNLKPLWKFNPDQTMFLSRPAIFGQTIYVAGNQSDLGAYDGMLAALDAQTGKAVWQVTDLPAEWQKKLHQDVLPAFFSSPALTPDGKYLVIGQGFHEDKNCALLCFDTATHAVKWAVQTPLHIESSPAIFGDMAVVGAGAIEGKDGRAMGDPGFVLAVRISDGKELWRQAVNDPESSPVVDGDGMVFIGSGCNGNAVVAMRSAPDEELRQKGLTRIAWRTPVPYPALGDVTLAGDLVVVGIGNGTLVKSDTDPHGGVYAFDKKSGEMKWHRELGDLVLGSVAFRDGVLVCGCRTGEVVAMNSKDGGILWRNNISGRAPVLAGPAFTGKRVYAVSGDGYLAVLDARDGKMIGAKVGLNDPKDPGSGVSSSPPQVVGERVIVGSETGGVRCLAGTSE